ncbi:MAG: AI-2E family transporter [Rudaea sp.]|nr:MULTISPECIES: AI-2E family transporter [unclassified Rudaea]MBN8886445.1 AI-2E family transporter [Rudaea sp.]
MAPAEPSRVDVRRARDAAVADNPQAVAEALTRIWALALVVAIFAMLYFGREVFVPLALSALFAFMLEPLIAWLARWIGRTVAAVLVLIVVLAALVELGVVLSRQLQDLANQLPAYRGNLAAKIRDVVPTNNGVLAKLTHLSEDLQKTAEQAAPDKGAAAARGPLDVRVVDTVKKTPFDALEAYAEPLMGSLGTSFLVILLVVFMAIKADDLQERFIRLVGHGRIGVTARAIDDGSSRIRRYLSMQLVTNLLYGAALAAGLHFIGVPNALLWGGLATVLRFVPYVGPWIAAVPPLLLSLAVSPSWMGPLLTLGLFLALELVTSNVLEPWLYGASTGVSSFALIIAAVFWTTLWGPIGLLLSTPLTVCLVVLGRHIPSLAFLSVMLGEDDALSPPEQMYRRLLRQRAVSSGYEAAGNFVGANSLVQFYDQVLLPVVRTYERDYADARLQAEQRDAVAKSVRDMIDEVESESEYDGAVELPAQPCRVIVLPARAERDLLAGLMLVKALRLERFDAHAVTSRADVRRLLEELGEQRVDIVFVSATPPTTPDQAAKMCGRVKLAAPEQRMALGLWEESGDAQDTPAREEIAGVDAVVATIGEAVAMCEGYMMNNEAFVAEAAIPEQEDERLAALDRFGIADRDTLSELDGLTTEVAKYFAVPTAFVSLIHRDRQTIKSGFGLPPELAKAKSVARGKSICSHVVAKNGIEVVEDLMRDRRFAGNPLLREGGLRFYAGAPLHAPDGQPIGTLCVLDTVPRVFTKKQRDRLVDYAGRASARLAKS